MPNNTPPPGVGGLTWFCVSSMGVPSLFSAWADRPIRFDMDGLFVDNMAMMVAAAPLLLAIPLWTNLPGRWVGRSLLLTGLIAGICTPIWLYLAGRPISTSLYQGAIEGLQMTLCCAVPAIGLVAMSRARGRVRGSHGTGPEPGTAASLMALFEWGLGLESDPPLGQIKLKNQDRWRVVTWIMLFLSLGEAALFHVILWPHSPPLSLSVLTLHALIMVAIRGDCRALSLPVIQRTRDGLRLQIGLRAVLELHPGQIVLIEESQSSKAEELNLSLLGEANCRVHLDPPGVLGGILSGQTVRQLALGIEDRERLIQVLQSFQSAESVDS